MHWLHTKWPAGKVEKLPLVGENGSTNVSGVRVVGDLTGIPLLKFSGDTGTKAVEAFLEESDFQNRTKSEDIVDVGIIGAGVSGVAAAIAAKKNGLTYKLFEASEAFSTVINFPKRKPIFTYPTDMDPAGEMKFRSDIKEALVDELQGHLKDNQIETTPIFIHRVEKKGKELLLHHAKGADPAGPTRCHRVVVAIGRSGNFRKLGVPGEELDKVYNRLHDPKDFCGQHVLVVGGGDSAMETAIALGACGSHVTLSYRKPEFSRPKPENVDNLMALVENPSAEARVENPTSERITTAASSEMRGDNPPGSVRLMMASQPQQIEENKVIIKNSDGEDEEIQNDSVFAMIGREPPLDFFRRSGIKLSGEYDWKFWTTLSLFFLFCLWVYSWKAQYIFPFGAEAWNHAPLNWIDPDPAVFGDTFKAAKGWLGERLNNPSTFLGTMAISLQDKAFYYSLLYSLLILVFGIFRIRRRKTPYVTWQTATLTAIQVIPLFLLPFILLPLMGHNGWFDSGWMKTMADGLFPATWDGGGQGREYWRSSGLILAWPLMVWNWFTDQPLMWWLVIGFIQTFVLIPLGIYFFGKGIYCGWICSCGAMAETLGDKHRHKMLHGPVWNRVNMVGQVILLIALLLMSLKVMAWNGAAWADVFFKKAFSGLPAMNYAWMVDLFLAGAIGYGLYFWFSGRVWCRFACPLAALMHIYARFSKFRIFPEKKKCISCNVCTSVCHQGIDIMNFANKGIPMQDPECVRCSACVQMCPTGVLSFGRYGLTDGSKIILDSTPASRIQMGENATRDQRAENIARTASHNNGK